MPKMDKKRSQKNGLTDREVDIDGQGITERLYEPRNRRGLASIEDCVDASTQALENYIKKSNGILMTILATELPTEK